MPSFGSRYTIEAKIGSGGMGSVYRAWDSILNKPVAIKLLLVDFARDSVVRFHKEAKTTARLSHPNILKVLDLGQTPGGDLYLVMDLLEGESLSALIGSLGQVPPEIALPIFIQICAGLEHAHNHDILHRDIKPSNVMLVEDDRGRVQAKIVDFGLAKEQSEDQSLTAPGSTIGSPAYMSPEHCQGQDLDGRSDLYSLGCLIYETLSGRTPFPAESLLEAIQMHVNEISPPLIAQMGLEFPEELSRLVAKLLEKSPSDRFQSAGQVSQALEEINQLYFAGLAESAVPVEDATPVQMPAFGWGALSTGRSRIIGIVIFVLLSGFFCLFYISNVSQKSKEVVSIPEPILSAPVITKIFESDVELGHLQHRNREGWYQALPSFSDKDLLIFKSDPDRFERISLSGSNVTGKRFSILGKIGLKGLDLIKTSIDDRALKAAIAGNTIDSLFLDSTGVTDDGVKELSSLTELKNLSLRNLDITDSPLASIGALPSLVYLNLSGCSKVSDNGLMSLSGMKHLRHLIVHECSNISTSGIKRFKKTNTNCEVHTDDMFIGERQGEAWANEHSKMRMAWTGEKGGAEKLKEMQLWPVFARLEKDPEFLELLKKPSSWKDEKVIKKVKNPEIRKFITDPLIVKYLDDPGKLRWMERHLKERQNRARAEGRSGASDLDEGVFLSPDLSY